MLYMYNCLYPAIIAFILTPFQTFSLNVDLQALMDSRKDAEGDRQSFCSSGPRLDIPSRKLLIQLQALGTGFGEG